MKHQNRFNSLFKQYLGVCKKYMNRFPWPLPIARKNVEHCDIRIDKNFKFTTVIGYNYVQTASIGFMGNKKTKEYMALVAFLSDHKIIGRRVGEKAFAIADFGAASVSSAVFIGNLLTEYLRRNKSFGYNHRIISSLYKRIVKFYSNNKIEAIIKCYLENVGIKSKSFRICDNVIVKSFTYKDIEFIYNNNESFRKFYSGPWTEFNRFKYIKGELAVRLSSRIFFKGNRSSKYLYDARFAGQRIINNVLMAFMLHTLGDVSCSPVTI